MREDNGPRTGSGLWTRRGRTIVLSEGGAAGSPRRAAPQGEVGGSPPARTVCDFIDPRIDVAAQHALFGLLRRAPFARVAALGMLGAVKAGTLAIYQEDQERPAKRARARGIGWWDLIPRGSLSTCIDGPPPGMPPPVVIGAPALIVFRRSLASDPFALGTELMRVWSTCGVVPVEPPPASKKPCTRPPPPAPTGGGGPATGAPVIELDSVEMGFEAPRGTTERLTSILTIRNAGTGDLEWQVSTTGGWLTLRPHAGTVPPSGAGRVAVIADPAAMPEGTYTVPIRVSSPRAANSPRIVHATLRIRPR